MVKVSVQIRNGAATFGVAVRARSIERALSLVQQRYPEGEVRAKFPIEPERLFVAEGAARARLAGFGSATEDGGLRLTAIEEVPMR